MFPVLNMADQDITVRETSGTNQTIEILNKEKGLVAVTLSNDRSPLTYVAVAKTGNDTLMVSGQKVYILNLKTLGTDDSFLGLYVTKEGINCHIRHCHSSDMRLIDCLSTCDASKDLYEWG